MDIKILIFDGLTALDAVGPYEVFRSVPGWEVEFVAPRAGEVRTDAGSLGLHADRAYAEVDGADLLLVPGGAGNRRLLKDEPLLAWLREIDRGSRWTTSVCTGSLVLGAAGLLEGRRATSYWPFVEALRTFGAEPVVGRFVEDGKVITSAGISAGIDMALYLVGREAGPEVAEAVQLGLEYDPQPPFDSGHPSKAPEAIVELVSAVNARDAELASLPDSKPA